MQTLGGKVRCCVKPGGQLIEVEMGQVSFDAARIPVSGCTGDVINQTIVLEGATKVQCSAPLCSSGGL